jgi:uncharacterized protein YoxC
VFLNILSHEGIAYRYLWWGSPAMAMLSKCVFIILGGSAFIWFLYAIFKDWNSQFTQRYRYFAIVSSTLLGLFLLLYIVAMLFWCETFGRLVMQGYNIAIALMLLGSLFSIVYYVIKVENNESFAVRFLLFLAVFLVVIMGVVIFLNNLVDLNFIKKYLPNFIQNAFAVPRYWTWMFFLGELIVSIGILIFKLVYIHRKIENRKNELEAQITQRTKEKEDLFAQLRELTSKFEEAKDNEGINEIIDDIEEVQEAIKSLEEDIEELDKKITPTDYEVQDIVLALTETNLRKPKFDIFNDITAITYISKGKYGKDKPKAIAIKLSYKNRTNMLQSNRFVLIAIFIIQNELSNTDTNLEDLYDFGISDENNRTNNSIGNMFSRYIGISFTQFKTDIKQAISTHKLTTVEAVRTWLESQKIEETGATKYAIVTHWAKRDKIVQYQKANEAGKKTEKFW